MASDDGATDLVELRPAPAVLLRHRDADLDVVTAPRTGPRVELRRGALWIRAGEDGPGVTVTHGAASVQLRSGAGVVEVQDVEALLVVASGRAAVKGVSPLPRSVIAGQAVVLTLDGTFSDPDSLSAAELAADRMVVENLALDNLASASTVATLPTPPPVAEDPVSAEAAVAPDGAAEEPALPTRVPGATTEARVDPPLAPRVRPESEGAPDGPSPAAEPAPPTPPVGRPAPALPTAGPSALEMALAGVGVTDTPLEPGENRTPVAPPPGGDGAAAGPSGEPERSKRRRGKQPTEAKEPKKTSASGSTGPEPLTLAPSPPRSSAEQAAVDAEDRAKVRIVIYLVVIALLVLALVAAVVFSA